MSKVDYIIKKVYQVKVALIKINLSREKYAI